MHRSYQPILPCGNKYLQQKWDKTYYDEHKKKVQSAKPVVDTNSPHTYVHLNTKMKKLKLEEERLAVIERDNHLLLQKMSAIMRTKGRVDNKNEYEAKSLNKEKRYRELLRLSKENQTILDRITKCEPQYQVEKWHEDWVKAEKYMDSIARYPRGWWCQEKSELGDKKESAKGMDSSESSVREKKTKKGNMEDKDKRKRMVSNKEVGAKSRVTKDNQAKDTDKAREIHHEPKNYTTKDGSETDSDLGGDGEGYEDSAEDEEEHAADERAADAQPAEEDDGAAHKDYDKETLKKKYKQEENEDDSGSDAKSDISRSTHRRVQKEDEEEREHSGDEKYSDAE
ncbi:hypothetical protein XENTR_v10006313 [Xenopus tropicalis]|uniref:CFAP97 domain containing 1 n=2 Tax=Xenopus tropicalis TaxID=8364 RepID=F6RL00_XENTR|nr:uncharacterized protein CFAP97D2 isoform X1 [Xenopus tropicalis]KAE8625537.1 hypothetical protein XENTR_v10006313 [Xenopus tropicalis]|eukprot:XP_012812129.1 PREDICTED: uncharacterized protein LOC394955 isoform X1 [Xenopus tropicalis]